MTIEKYAHKNIIPIEEEPFFSEPKIIVKEVEKQSCNFSVIYWVVVFILLLALVAFAVPTCTC